MSGEAAAAAPAAKPTAADDGLVARLGSKAREFARQAKAERTRADLAESQLKALRTEADQLKAAPGSDTVAKLQAELRTRDYRAAFDRAARKEGVQEGDLDDLWTLAKIDTAAETVDAAAIAAAVTTQKTARPKFFGQATQTADGTTTVTEPEPKPGPGSGRGGPAPAGKIAEKFTTEQLSDPVFVMKNYARIQAAAKINANDFAKANNGGPIFQEK